MTSYVLEDNKIQLQFSSILRLDNSRRGAIHVLCDISRTKIAITSCDTSNERAYFSARDGANGILMKFELKERQF